VDGVASLSLLGGLPSRKSFFIGGGAFLVGTFGLDLTGRSLSSSSAGLLLSLSDPFLVVYRCTHFAFSAPYTFVGLLSSCVALVGVVF
jgi:hypothetical protein